MISAPLVIAASFAYLVLLFAVAYVGDARAREGRSKPDSGPRHPASSAAR